MPRQSRGFVSSASRATNLAVRMASEKSSIQMAQPVGLKMIGTPMQQNLQVVRAAAADATKPPPDFYTIISNAGKRALGGGIAGAGAMAIQVQLPLPVAAMRFADRNQLLCFAVGRQVCDMYVGLSSGYYVDVDADHNELSGKQATDSCRHMSQNWSLMASDAIIIIRIPS